MVLILQYLYLLFNIFYRTCQFLMERICILLGTIPLPNLLVVTKCYGSTYRCNHCQDIVLYFCFSKQSMTFWFSFCLFICYAVIDTCLSNPCLNGGQCIEQSGFTYSCVCTSQWSGGNCSERKFKYSFFFEKSYCGIRLFLNDLRSLYINFLTTFHPHFPHFIK